MKRVTMLVLATAVVLAVAQNEARGEKPEVRWQNNETQRLSSAVVGGTDAITIPRLLSYQGKLTDTLGLPVADTLYSIRFRLYSQPSGGTQFWEETQSVRTRAGLFSVLLGSVTPIGTIPDGGAVYLGMAVGGGAELAPRLQIASAAYAYLSERAANADLLQGKDTTALDSRYVNEGQAGAVTSAMISDGTIAAADLGRMGASTGQVMKWSGSAWVPANDSVGVSGGGTVTSVSQGAGVVCTPNPITTTGTVRFDSVWGDDRYIRNQYASAQTGNFWMSGTCRAGQFYGVANSSAAPGIYGNGGTYAAGVYGQSGTSSYPGVYGSGGTVADGVYGQTNTSGCYGVAGYNGNASGVGIVGAGQGQSISVPTGGCGGAFVGSSKGGYLKANATNGTGVIGVGNGVSFFENPSSGAGGAFTGTVYGACGYATNTSGGCYGIYGLANSPTGFGLFAGNQNSSGTGLLATGQGSPGSYLTAGSGVAGVGTSCGIYGRASSTGVGQGGYFSNGYGAYAYVSYYNGTTNYKILGNGTVSTIMATRDGRKTLFAPEMPEPYFEDAGVGQLVNGHCRINLEPVFVDCITVNDEHPLKVFVQLEDDCRGVYVKKNATGFDVYELQGGQSDARFSWRVLAKWKGNEGLRLPEAPGPLETATAATPASVTGTTEQLPLPEPIER